MKGVEVDPSALTPHLHRDERIVVVAAGELLGPAVARGLDVTWGRVVGPQPSVLVVATDSRIVVVRRQPGGRLDDVLWVVSRDDVGAGATAPQLLVLHHAGDQLVFRPTDPDDLERLRRALATPPDHDART